MNHRSHEAALRESEKRQASLLKLSDTMSPLSDPLAIKQAAVRIVGEQVQADIALYAEISDDGETIHVADCYTRGSFPEIRGRFAVKAFSNTVVNTLRSGKTFVVASVADLAGITKAEIEACAALNIVSSATVPLVKGGRWVANLGVCSGSLRQWSAEEILLLQEAAERTWAAIERARAEEALRESEARVRQLVERSPFGIYIVNSQFRIIHMNESGQRGAFRNVRPVIGRDLAEAMRILWPESVAADIARLFRHTLNTGEPYCSRDFVNWRADIHQLEGYEWELYRLTLPNGEWGVICYYFDATKLRETESAMRKAQERLQRWNEDLEQAVTMKTAELMQSQGRLRALSTELSLAEQRERKRLATELHDHLQQLLVLGKLKLGQGKRLAQQVPACVDLMQQTDDVLAEALKYTRTLVAELSPPVLRDHGLAAGLKWIADYMSKQGQTVTVSVLNQSRLTLPEDQTTLLFQSVRELLMNSRKHAGTGEVEVVLDHSDGNLMIQVRDNGKGFDPAAAAAAAEDAGGGISSKFGLFSIRERMRALGGSFDIQSAPGRGTTAMLTLPLTRSVETNVLSPELGGTEESVHSASGTQCSALPKNAIIRVLLVDDHTMVRQGLRSVLDAYDDIQVVGEARDGEEAVQLVKELRPRLVVMDINMPRMNGVEATRHIKTHWPETLVIGISVNAGDDNGIAMKRAGAAVLLTKEAAVDDLYRTIQDTLNAEANV